MDEQEQHLDLAFKALKSYKKTDDIEHLLDAYLKILSILNAKGFDVENEIHLFNIFEN